MLTLSLLGELNIRLHDKPITRFRSQKEIALLAYLAHTGQTHSREAVADLLWEARSTKQSLSNLRTTLARLRKQVGDHLIVTRKTVAVTPDVHAQTDSVRFQAMLADVGKEGSVTAVNLLSQGLKLYSGEFLAGFSLPQTPRFNDWLIVEQERIRQTAMRGYRQLTGWQEEQGDFAAGVITAQQWVDWNPLDEMAQQQFMRLLTFDGQPAEALAAYEKCRQLLQTELDISPAPSTIALYEAIQEGSLSPPEITPTPLHNLPRALTPLYGRQKESERLKNSLLNSEYPLISITGVGGIGKTSLALAVGRKLLAEKQHPFKDGIWFISLEEIENDAPEKIRNRVAALMGQAMGLFFHGERYLWSQLLGQLTSKNILLILDNIEQFLTVASDLIIELLAAGDNIQLLATSRTGLALGASVAFPLTGLETPTQVSEEALQNESVQLFAERAAQMPVLFNLEENLAEVVTICQFVQGLPLGIELAAASLGRLMIAEILPALTSNLYLLNTTHGDLPPRQRTLHAVFDHSWQLLDPREQMVLAQISVFRGGFTRQAAAAMLNNSASGLYHLQHHALLTRNETGRFRMHPLLRQLAAEKLNDPIMIEFSEQALNRHTLYFAEFMQSFEDQLQRGEGQEALQTILPEQANLRAAWQQAVQAGQWQIIAKCLDSTHYFHKRKGFFSEEATLIDSAITVLQTKVEADDTFLISLFSRLLTVRAWGYLNSAKLEKGVEAVERACKLVQRLENTDPSTSDATSMLRTSIEAQARLVWARLLSKQNKHEPALTQYEQVVDLAKTAQNQVFEADGWIGVGSQILWQPDVKPAQEPLQHALNLCRTLQYKLGEMEALRYLGTLAYNQDAFALAIDYHEQALQLSRLLGDVGAEAEVQGALGIDLKIHGDLVGSQTHHRAALSTFRQLNMPESEQWLWGELGHTATLLGDYAVAEEQLTNALIIATQLKDMFWQTWVKLRLGVVWNKRGESAKSLPLLTEAFQTAEQLQSPLLQGMVLDVWGNVLFSQADWAQAEQKFQTAYDMLQKLGQTQRSMSSLAGLAHVAYQQEMPEIAAVHAEYLWNIWQESPTLAEKADLELYWRLGMVWQGLGDSRADNLWKKVRALLHDRSEKVPDEAARKMFLENVPVNQAILEIAL